MCEKCEEIDKKIERYRRMAGQVTDQEFNEAGQVTDQEFNERAMEQIAELEAQKAALHPEQK